MQDKQMKDMEIGQRSTFVKTITEADITLFAGLTGDFNRIHVDEEYAKSTQFKGRIAHGFLIASLVQPCMSKLTTPGGVSLNYNFDMKLPVFIHDTITASAEIIKKRTDKPIVTLRIQCRNQHDNICIDGEALIYMVSDKEKY